MRNHTVMVHLVTEYVTTFMEEIENKLTAYRPSRYEWDRCMQIYKSVVAFLNDSAFHRKKEDFCLSTLGLVPSFQFHRISS